MTRTIEDINLNTWFIKRELDFVPKHFAVSSIPITAESRIWIQEKLSGRYTMLLPENIFLGRVPAFEDPKEAMFYALTWG